MEILDIYDKNGNTTGKTIIRGDKTVVLNEDEHIAISVIFIENDRGEFLIQKTSKEKGGKYSSTGGHVSSGQTPLETIKREVKEELGINIDNEEIKQLGYTIINKPLFYQYYLKKNVDINEVNLQKEEVDFVKYMNISQINDLIKNGEMLESHATIFNNLIKTLKK